MCRYAEEDRCSDRCPIAWIGDGQCDPECLSEECEFDGQDCDPAPTTTPVPSAEPGQANTEAAVSDPGNAAMVAEDPTEDVDVEEVTEEVQPEAPADPTSVEQPSDWCAPMCHSPNMVSQLLIHGPSAERHHKHCKNLPPCYYLPII